MMSQQTDIESQLFTGEVIVEPAANTAATTTTQKPKQRYNATICLRFIYALKMLVYMFILLFMMFIVMLLTVVGVVIAPIVYSFEWILTGKKNACSEKCIKWIFDNDYKPFLILAVCMGVNN